MEALEEAQERYAQARARREKFLMEAQRNFQVRQGRGRGGRTMTPARARPWVQQEHTPCV